MWNKFIIFLCLVCGILTLSFFKIDEGKNTVGKRDKYILSICSIFKNEALYLKEWIEYHRIFGVDHFYLYNIGSSDSFQTVLRPYIKEGLVTLVNWPEVCQSPEQDNENVSRWALSTQIPAYENALHFLAKFETKWLVFVDIDEFLVCPEGNTMAELLEKYEEHPGISIASDCFDAATPASPKKKLLIQNTYLTRAPVTVERKAVTKMIFKPAQCTGFIWPPYQCRFKDSQHAVSIDRTEMRINRYVNRNIRRAKTSLNDRIHVDNRFLSHEEITALLDEGYVIDDQERPIIQYVPELSKRMGFAP